MISLLVVFCFCLIFSAFFSGSEMAFVSVNKFKLRELADTGSRAAGRVLRLQERPQHFLTTILIGNNIVNVAATAILTYLIHSFFGIDSEWLVMGVMTPLLLIFGEMIPKDYCRLRSLNFMMKYSTWLSLLSRLTYAPVTLLLKVIQFFLGPINPAHKSIFVSEDEFRMLIEETTQTGVLGDHEKKMIDTILDFERIRVRAVMTSLDKVPKVDITSKVGEVKNLARKTKARMVLVTEGLPNLVVGVVNVFDLLFEDKDDKPLKEFLRAPVFVPWTTSIEKAFLTLQHKRQSYAVVTNPFGDVAGVVPIEKLLVL